VREQVGDPGGAVHVGLASPEVLDVHRVGEHQLERLLEHMPDRLPVDAGGLHRDVRHLVFGEPVSQPKQFLRRRAEALDDVASARRLLDAHAGDDRVLVDVEPRATVPQNLGDIQETLTASASMTA
jgi:hypothetical protein